MHRELVSDSVGIAEISPCDIIAVNHRGSWKIKYTAGPGGILIGGKVRITIPHGFSPPQITEFFNPGFCTVEAEVKGLILYGPY